MVKETLDALVDRSDLFTAGWEVRETKLFQKLRLDFNCLCRNARFEKGMKMKANPAYLLDALSNQDVTFLIPPYQRNYEWKIDTCKVFLADVKKVADGNNGGFKTEHFFGSIVYVVEESGFGQPSKYILTDGQQRITTTMLFLLALRDSINDEAYRDTIQTRYIENHRVSDELKIKLKQVETDWEAYKSLALGAMENLTDSVKGSAIYQNYVFFKKEFDRMSVDEMKSLLEKGLVKFSIIAIELEPVRNSWENPQEIFESMNSLGQPLALADLVRNYLLLGMTSKQQSKLYSEYWLKLEKQLPGKLSEFIRDWMQADQHRSYKVAKDSNHKELYGQFKEIVSNRTSEELLAEFVRFLDPYLIVSGERQDNNETINRLIEDLHIIGINPAYSYLTEVMKRRLEGGLSELKTLEIFGCLRTYLLRRRILRITQAENKAFPTLGLQLNDIARCDDATQEFYKQLSSNEYALRLPNDEELKSRLRAMNFYNFGSGRANARLLLSMIEEALTKARPSFDDDNLQLEHIMPQTLSNEWRQMLGPDFQEIHNELVNNIGNIALIRHNQELGNQTFEKKKALYADKSGLQGTQNKVLTNESWDKVAIVSRQKYLIEILLNDVLQIPKEFKSANNWRQSDDLNLQFDAKKILNQLIGFKIQYIPDRRIEAEVINDSEVFFEGQKWKLSPLTTELKRRAGRVSNNSSFHGASNWEYDGERLSEIDY